MAKCPTESTCKKKTHQVKQADLVFEESAIEEHLIEEMNKEKKEEPDQEESFKSSDESSDATHIRSTHRSIE